MSRLTIIVVIACALVVGAAAFFAISLTSGDAETPSAARPTTAPVEKERHEQAERFFGGDPERDVRGGQEMKPRW